MICIVLKKSNRAMNIPDGVNAGEQNIETEVKLGIVDQKGIADVPLGGEH